MRDGYDLQRASAAEASMSGAAMSSRPAATMDLREGAIGDSECLGMFCVDASECMKWVLV